MKNTKGVEWSDIYVLAAGAAGVVFLVQGIYQVKGSFSLFPIIILIWWLWLMYNVITRQARRDNRRLKILNDPTLDIKDYCTECYGRLPHPINDSGAEMHESEGSHGCLVTLGTPMLLMELARLF